MPRTEPGCPWAASDRPCGTARIPLPRSQWGSPRGSIPGWKYPFQDLVSLQGLLQPAPSCPVPRGARHRGWPQGSGEALPGQLAFCASAWLPQPLL